MSVAQWELDAVRHEYDRILIGPPPPCPPGCLEPEGHDYDSVQNETARSEHPTFVRFHEFHRGGGLSVNQWETNRRGEVMLRAPHIFIGDGSGEFTLDAATEFSAELNKALQVLRRVAA